jgi:hypothetical protein
MVGRSSVAFDRPGPESNGGYYTCKGTLPGQRHCAAYGPQKFADTVIVCFCIESIYSSGLLISRLKDVILIIFWTIFGQRMKRVIGQESV